MFTFLPQKKPDLHSPRTSQMQRHKLPFASAAVLSVKHTLPQQQQSLSICFSKQLMNLELLHQNIHQNIHTNKKPMLKKSYPDSAFELRFPAFNSYLRRNARQQRKEGLRGKVSRKDRG